MSEMVAEVLNAAPEKFALAGFSMGGYVALEVLRQSPERVTRLALLDTTLRTDTPEKIENRLNTISECEAGRYDMVIQNMFNVLLHPDHQQGDIRNFVTEMARRVGSESFVLRHKAMMGRKDGREILAHTDIPVRAICGRQDAMNSVQEHMEISDMVSRGRLSIIEECGHMTILECPQAATALMRDWFLYD